ncbi:hypothetical protein CKO38_03280 [Rhodospirillum rubrum]|uniref:M48 family metallopeptidase n=1 Tax=Rhodospirillum rubrum TaxID=1085 RepID=UPI001908C3C3|nr:SprT family zinc-dependent metalloprotease [Rhodospirillum rubrum]MBK1663102.1 hypothetical protein [Rhodospirillum rubrum]MBK1675713.1 hypothetical protein [Rhodospirillum rubrum]
MRPGAGGPLERLVGRLRQALSPPSPAASAKPPKPATPTPAPAPVIALCIDGESLPVTLRRNPRAKRLTLRLDPQGDGVVVVAPPHVALTVLKRFVADKSDWVRMQRTRLPAGVAFTDGATVPLLGVPHVLRHQPEGRRGVWVDDGALRVSGQADHLARRTTDWLKRRARTEILARAHRHAGQLGVTPTRITLRDTRSRWGSCSSSGALSFSWRLILAPEAVLDYVVAHEVAHLVEFNHSPRFWAVVGQLVDDPTVARAWLRQNGPGLHRYG